MSDRYDEFLAVTLDSSKWPKKLKCLIRGNDHLGVDRPPRSQSVILESLRDCPAWRYISSLESPASRRTTGSRLRTVAQWHGLPDWYLMDWRLIGFAEMDAICSHARSLLNAGQSPRSLALLVSLLKGVAKKSFGLGLLSGDELAKIKSIRPPRNVPTKSVARLLTPGQQAEVLQKSRVVADRPEIRLRDEALLAVLFFSGLRRSEVCALTLKSLDRERSIFEFVGKGGKRRTVPVVPQVLECIDSWLEIRGTWEGPLFCGIHRSGSIVKRPLKPSTIYTICKKYETLELRFSPHDCRRSFATAFIRHTRDLLSAQRILGHSSVSTTQIYDLSDSEVDQDNMNFFSERLRRDD